MLEKLLRARYGAAPQFTPPAELPPALLALLDRRVTRRYRSDPIPGPLLDTLLACAQSAPSKSDLQQYSILVTQDARKIAQVAEWIGTMPWIKDAPVLLLFCGDLRRARRICAMQGREHANDNMDSYLNSAVDAALAMGAFMAAADAAGLGTCPISYVRSHIAEVSELFSLPPGVHPVAGLTLGWPVERNAPSARLPASVVVHRESYDDAGLEEAVTAYDALRPRAKPRYPEVHGPKPEGCLWSENLARQLSVPERAFYRDWLLTQGFRLD
jgi:nitroreductase/FMN reductase [NAD(P)H]